MRVDIIRVPPRLGDVLRELARTSVFACSIAAAACGGIDAGDFDAIPCESAAATQWVVEEVDSPEEAILVARSAGYDVSCDQGRGGVRAVEGGYEILGRTTSGGCGSDIVVKQHVLFVEPDGQLTEVASEVVSTKDGSMCPGRRPPGFLQPGERGSGVAAFLARSATLEAASVDAFVVIARELRAHGAPAALVRAAARSAADEVRHARAMGVLARREGVVPARPRRVQTPLRSLVGLALDNAKEGCVNETYAALVAVHQSRAAGDATVARAMGPIAADEVRHAGLSWAIAAWADGQLGRAERHAVRTAREEAVAELAVSARAPEESALVRRVGLPGPAAAGWMVDRLAEEVWG